ncbi:MAG: UDP-N-acetylmuramoyl-L-alanine--D-glutamate ligase [Patescibacteria group bacterium]|jgi:UDP-N-acetylmuramoylalanine--D-glutamate ligase
MKHKWKNKRVLIMGLGLYGGGLAATKYFLKHGAKIVVTDLRDAVVLRPSLAKLKNARVSYTLGRHEHQDFMNADIVIQNPGVPNNSPLLKTAQKAGARIENEAGIFFSQVKVPIIGITGTKGKSTTTTLVWQILKQVKPKTLVAGNIRTTAMLEIIDRLPVRNPVVLELSSWQLEGLVRHRISPHAALITNVLPDHLNRYRSFAHYRDTKGIILEYQKPNDIGVLNYDNDSTRLLGKRVRSKLFWFSKQPFTKSTIKGAFADGDQIYFGTIKKNVVVMPVSEIQLLGGHNLENVLGAITLTAALGVSLPTIRRVVRKFKGIPDRLELIRTVGGVQYINDTTATAPIATLAAIKALAPQGPLFLIAGGQNKDLDYQTLCQEIDRSVKAVILLPGNASDIIRHNIAKRLVYPAADMEQAVKIAAGLARSGETVVLSPAAASFNLFKNEFDRAEQFVKAVRRLS